MASTLCCRTTHQGKSFPQSATAPSTRVFVAALLNATNPTPPHYDSTASAPSRWPLARHLSAHDFWHWLARSCAPVRCWCLPLTVCIIGQLLWCLARPARTKSKRTSRCRPHDPQTDPTRLGHLTLPWLSCACPPLAAVTVNTDAPCA
jgi:hypothetical protein